MAGFNLPSDWPLFCVLALPPYLAYLVALIAVDAVMGLRKGFALLSVAAIVVWSLIALALADDARGGMIAGGVTLLLHLRPLYLGVMDRGFIAIRLRGGEQSRRQMPNPRGRSRWEERPRRCRLCWLALIAVAAGGYVFRGPLVAAGRQAAAVVALVPGAQIPEVTAPRDRSGSFAFDTQVNGTPMTLVFDAEAPAVTLRAEDAARLGITPGPSAFKAREKLSDGVKSVAQATIETLVIGDITLHDVPAFVAKPGSLAQSRLGQSALSRLKSYGLRDDRMVLTGH